MTWSRRLDTAGPVGGRPGPLATAAVVIAGAALLGLAAPLSGCSDATNPPQTGTVRGEVVRIHGGQPIAGATVDVAGQQTGTDADGRFSLRNVPHGPATVVVTAPEYRTRRRAVDVSDHQTLVLELMPVDTLLTVTGQVRHRLDGGVAAHVGHPGGSVRTDIQGHWRLVDLPLGPVVLTVDQPPYNPLAAQVVLHSENQHVELILTRDVTVTWPVTDDSYVFMHGDSLNANRGSAALLQVTGELGRTAVFSLEPPAEVPDVAVPVAARLHLHAHVAAGEDDPPGPYPFVLGLSALDAPFGEGAIDAFFRPTFLWVGVAEVTVAAGPPAQPLDVDLLPAYTSGPAAGTWGVAIGTATDAPPLVIQSSEAAEPALRPRASLTYRY